jgi:hypothetical protein
LIIGLFTPENISVEDQQILDDFCKFKEINLAVQATKHKIQQLDWMTANYQKNEGQMQAYLKLPGGQTTKELMKDTPQEKIILRLKVEWQESEIKKGRDTTLPLPPNLCGLVDSCTFDVTNVLTSEDIKNHSLEATDIFKRQLGSGVFQNNAELTGGKALLYGQIYIYVERVTRTVVNHSNIWCKESYHPVRSVQQLTHQKIIVVADHNTGGSDPGPASAIVLSQEWKVHRNADAIINWLYAVQINARKTKDTFGFYLAIQTITRETVDHWKNLLNLSTGTINEVLGGTFSEILYIKEDLLYIIAKAWMNVEAMQGRDTFDAALGIMRNYSTLIAEPMAAPPIPPRDADGIETEDEEGEEEGSDDDDDAAAAAAAAGPAAAGPAAGPAAADAADAGAADATAAAAAAAAAAGAPPPNEKKRKGPPGQPGPPERITTAVYKFTGTIKEKPAGLMDEIRKQIEKLLGKVDPEYWDDVLVTHGVDTTLNGVKDELGLPAMYIQAIDKHGHKPTSVLAYYVTYLAAEELKIPEEKRGKLKGDNLAVRFGKAPKS